MFWRTENFEDKELKEILDEDRSQTLAKFEITLQVDKFLVIGNTLIEMFSCLIF